MTKIKMTKKEQVLHALEGIAKGYGDKAKDPQVQTTRDALRVLAGHVVDALTERRDSHVQRAAMDTLTRFGSTAFLARRDSRLRAVEQATEDRRAKAREMGPKRFIELVIQEFDKHGQEVTVGPTPSSVNAWNYLVTDDEGRAVTTIFSIFSSLRYGTLAEAVAEYL